MNAGLGRWWWGTIDAGIGVFVRHFRRGRNLSVVIGKSMSTNSESFLTKLNMSIVHQGGNTHASYSVDCSV